MTTKRVILIIGGVVGGLSLLVLIFVGVIFGVAWYSVGNSDAAARAKDFLKNNEKLKSDIGEVKGFGALVGGSINVVSEEATLTIKVEGERKTVTASVNLIFVNGNTWRVASASYLNAAGQKVNLLDPYDTKARMPLLSA